jgi:hypothetical protein
VATIFHYSELERFFRYIAGNFDTTSLRDWRGGPGVILRRDVDLEIGPAWEMSRLEEQCGIRSSYFIMMTNFSYNPGTRVNRIMLRDMAGRGFDVGLHFDPLVYGDVSEEDLAVRAREESAWLSCITGFPVTSVSIHNPSMHGLYPLFKGFQNAYDPAIFSPETYWSESRMAPRKDLWEFIQMAGRKTLQVLMHPFHFTPDGHGYRHHMSRHLCEYAKLLDGNFSPANSTYREAFPEGLSRAITLNGDI